MEVEFIDESIEFGVRRRWYKCKNLAAFVSFAKCWGVSQINSRNVKFTGNDIYFSMCEQILSRHKAQESETECYACKNGGRAMHTCKNFR